MLRRIIFPIIIFLTLLASANVRSLPLFVLAIAEIIFAGLMIALALFQRTKTCVSAVQKSLHLPKGEPCECKIMVKSRSPLPLNRFRLELMHGHAGGDLEESVLFGGTDKNEGFLKADVPTKYCGMYQLILKKLKCYDWFLLSSFSKSLQEQIDIAILPDETLKMRIISDNENVKLSLTAFEGHSYKALNGGTDVEDIRPYKDGDSQRHIYWKQSAKMNELWVREYSEEIAALPLISLQSAKLKGLEGKHLDSFARVFYALMLGVLETYGSFIFRISFSATGFEDYLISNVIQLKIILICCYKNEFLSLSEYLIKENTDALFLLSIDPFGLSISCEDRLLMHFEKNITDDEIAAMTIKI